MFTRVYGQLSELQTVYDAYNHATGFTYANGNNQTVTDALSRVTDNDYDLFCSYVIMIN